MGVPIPKTSKTLLEKLRSGDPVSQEEFYARYREMIFALGRLKGLSETESEDLVQLVMSEFFQKSTDFIWDPARGKFRTWFGTVIKRRGKGLPSVQGYGRGTGDLYVKILVWIPRKLSRSEKDMLESIRNNTTFTPDLNRDDKAIFDKEKNIF